MNGFTTEDAAAELGVSAGLIAKWKHLKKVVPIGFVRGRGHDAPLYELDDLRPLVEAYRARQQRRATRRHEGAGLPSGVA